MIERLGFSAGDVCRDVDLAFGSTISNLERPGRRSDNNEARDIMLRQNLLLLLDDLKLFRRVLSQSQYAAA